VKQSLMRTVQGVRSCKFHYMLRLSLGATLAPPMLRPFVECPQSLIFAVCCFDAMRTVGGRGWLGSTVQMLVNGRDRDADILSLHIAEREALKPAAVERVHDEEPKPFSEREACLHSLQMILMISFWGWMVCGEPDVLGPILQQVQDAWITWGSTTLGRAFTYGYVTLTLGLMLFLQVHCPPIRLKRWPDGAAIVRARTDRERQRGIDRVDNRAMTWP